MGWRQVVLTSQASYIGVYAEQEDGEFGLQLVLPKCVRDALHERPEFWDFLQMLEEGYGDLGVASGEEMDDFPMIWTKSLFW